MKPKTKSQKKKEKRKKKGLTKGKKDVNAGLILDRLSTVEGESNNRYWFKLIYFTSIVKQVLRTYTKALSMFASWVNQYLCPLCGL